MDLARDEAVDVTPDQAASPARDATANPVQIREADVTHNPAVEPPRPPTPDVGQNGPVDVAHDPAVEPRHPAPHDGGETSPVDLGRLAWLVTVLVCLVTVFILVLNGYLGYAAVTFSVAVAAGINMF